MVAAVVPRPLVILGVDPGFASFGFALLSLAPGRGAPGVATGVAERVEALGLIETQKANKKQAVYASDDTVKRSRELMDVLDPLFAGASVVAAESMSYPRSSTASCKMGIGWGLIAALAWRYQLPIVQISPQEIKKIHTGRKDASKEDIQEALGTRWGDNFRDQLHKIKKSGREHPADAAAAAAASLNSDVVRGLVRSLALQRSQHGRRGCTDRCAGLRCAPRRHSQKWARCGGQNGRSPADDNL